MKAYLATLLKKYSWTLIFYAIGLVSYLFVVLDLHWLLTRFFSGAMFTSLVTAPVFLCYQLIKNKWHVGDVDYIISAASKVENPVLATALIFLAPLLSFVIPLSSLIGLAWLAIYTIPDSKIAPYLFLTSFLFFISIFGSALHLLITLVKERYAREKWQRERDNDSRV